MKKVLAFLLAVCMVLSMAACGDSSASSSTGTPASIGTSDKVDNENVSSGDEADSGDAAAVVEPYEFNISYGGTDGSSMWTVAQLLMDELSAASNGAFTFNIYTDPGYKESQALDELMNDIVDIVYLASGSISTTITDVAYLGMPGAYRYTDDAEAFFSFEEALAPTLESIFADYGIKYLGLRVPSKMVIAGTGDAVHTPADMKGKIARVAGTWLGKMCVSLDIGTATLGGSEIVTGLQRGTIDACITGIELMNTNMIYEASDYMSIFGEVDGIGSMTMDMDCWNKLSDAQKAAVEVAVEKWMQGCLELSQSFSQVSIDKCEQAGLEIIELTDEECDEWLSTIDQIYEEVDASATEKGIELKNAMLDWRSEHLG